MPAFCAQYSRNVGEPLSGNGAHLRSNLLLSWPNVYWTRIFHQARDMTIGESRLVADLFDLVAARQLSLSTMELIRSNIALTEVTNTGIMAGAGMDFLSSVLSALLHNGTTIGILLRALNKKTITEGR